MPDLDVVLAKLVSDAVEARVTELGQGVLASQAELELHAKQLAFVMRKLGVFVREDGETENGEPVVPDRTWQCVKCGARLGYYDEAEDLLRVFHDGVVVYVNPGAGGRVMVPCRRCGEMNTVASHEG